MARDPSYYTGESKPARIRRRITQGCLITAAVLIGANVLLVLVVPYLGLVEFLAIKNLVSPPPPTPYTTSPLQTQMTLWQGSLYAYGPNGSTSVFDPNTGAPRATLPGLVIGSDDDLLYTSQGTLNAIRRYDSPVGSPSGWFPLIARDASGAQVWSYSPATESGGIAQLQSSGDLVYLLEMPNATSYPEEKFEIVALNKSDGSERWNYTWSLDRDDYLGSQLPQCFVIAQQALYLHTPKQVIALSANDGRQEWQRTIDTYQVVPDEQLLYLPSDQGLNVLSADSGADVWHVSYAPSSSHASFLLDKHMVYLSDSSGHITARRGDTGQRLWQTTSPTGYIPVLLAVQDGVIYLLDNGPGKLQALSANSGHVLWTTPWNALNASYPSIESAVVGAVQGAVYFSRVRDCSSVLGFCSEYSAFNEQSGKLLWQRQIPEWGIASTLSGQMFYSVSLLHRRQVTIDGGIAGAHHATVTNCSDIASLHALSLTSGTFTWQRATPFRCVNDTSY